MKVFAACQHGKELGLEPPEAFAEYGNANKPSNEL
jgi:hypothetical protein